MKVLSYYIFLSFLSCFDLHSQEFKTHRSNLLNFTVQIPSDAIVLNEAAELGILFRSEYWKKLIFFTPISFVDPASISSFELSGYMLLNNLTPIESSYILDRNYLCQKIKTVIGNQSAIGYCIFLPWTRQQGIAMIMMYGEVNGFGDKLQAIALEYAKGFNNSSYKMINPLTQSQNTTEETATSYRQPVESTSSSYISKYAKYLSPAKDNKNRPKDLLSGVYLNAPNLASSSYSDGSTAYMIGKYYYIFLSNGAYCSIKAGFSSSFSEGSIVDNSEEIMDYGHWYIGDVEHIGNLKNTVFIKSKKSNSLSYQQWLYHTFLYNQPVLYDSEMRRENKLPKITTQIKLSKIEEE